MTVLFGSYATSSTRAPTHASENTDESLNRLFDDGATPLKNGIGEKMVNIDVFDVTPNYKMKLRKNRKSQLFMLFIAFKPLHLAN